MAKQKTIKSQTAVLKGSKIASDLEEKVQKRIIKILPGMVEDIAVHIVQDILSSDVSDLITPVMVAVRQDKTFMKALKGKVQQALLKVAEGLVVDPEEMQEGMAEAMQQAIGDANLCGLGDCLTEKLQDAIGNMVIKVG